MPAPPTANFSHTTAGLTASFTDLSTDSDGTITDWAWDFGDGNTSMAQNPIHTFAFAGNYTVCLEVTDDSGLSDTACNPITVVASCDVMITNVTSTPPTCLGGTDGTITVTATGTGTIEYSIDGVNFQTNNVFNTVAANAYTATARIQGSSPVCEATQMTTVPAGTDGTDPVISCPANVNVECDAIPLPGIATATDNCDPNPVITYLGEVISPGSCNNNFTVTRTWQAEDASNNTKTCNQVITAEDHTDPVISCPANVTVECNAIPAVGTATATDNCDPNPVITYLGEMTAPGSCGNNSTVTRTWQAEDACTNTKTCNQVITVNDTQGPVMSCTNTTITPGADGSHTLSQAEINALGSGTTDNCGSVTFSISQSLFTCAHEGANNVTLTGTDECNNPNTCPVTVTVNEYLSDPSVSCTAETCAGAGDGSLTVSATALGGQVKYSIDGGNSYQVSGVFNNLVPGTYNIVAKVFGINNVCEKTGMKTVAAGPAPTVWLKDLDGDGFTDGLTQTSCVQPTGYVASATAGDCNDNDANLFPGQTWHRDADNDGYSDGTTQTSCPRPSGHKTAAELSDPELDCDDGNANISPGATEVCNGIDDNCNSQIDEGVSGGLTWTGNVAFATQAAVDAFSQCYSIIDGTVFMTGFNITNLSNLNNWEEVTGNLTMQVTGLGNFNGLDNLTGVGGTLTIYYNPSLTSLTGLGNLSAVGGNLMMYYNLALANCCDIDALLEGGGVSGVTSIFINATGSHCNSAAAITAACPLAPPLIAPPSSTSLSEQSVSLYDGKDMSLYPNPARNRVNVLFNRTAPTANLRVMDILGRVVFERQLEEGIENLTIDLDSGQFKNGLYLVSFFEDGEMTSKQLVVRQ